MRILRKGQKSKRRSAYLSGSDKQMVGRRARCPSCKCLFKLEKKDFSCLAVGLSVTADSVKYKVDCPWCFGAVNLKLS